MSLANIEINDTKFQVSFSDKTELRPADALEEGNQTKKLMVGKCSAALTNKL